MDSAPLRVLLVGDLPENRRDLRQLLAQAAPGGYTVVEADRGDLALLACQSAPPDCVLLGQLRPDQDAETLLAALRDEVPVVLLADGEDQALEGLRRGAYDYLIKGGLTPLRLHLTLQHTVATSRPARAYDRTLAQLRAEAQAAQWAAAEAMSRLDALVTSAPNGICYLDRELRYQLINPALAALNGRTPEQHLGHTLAEMLPGLAPRLEPLMRLVLATGEAARDMELAGEPCPRDGFRHTWLMSIFPVRGGAGEVVGVGTVVVDITQSKRTVAALWASEARYRILFETMGQGVIYQDAAGRVTDANPAAEHILGLRQDQLRGSSVWDPGWSAVREDGTPFPTEELPWLVARRTGQAVHKVVLGVTHPGLTDLRWLQVHAVPLVLPGATTPGQIYTIFEDITTRRQARQTLEYERQQLDAIVSTLSEGLVAFTPDGTVVFCNGAALRLGGLDPSGGRQTLAALAQAMGLRPLDAQGHSLSPSTYPLARILRGEQFTNLELRIWHPEQRAERWLVCSGTPVYDTQGNLMLGVVTAQDISARKQAELALQARSEALSRTNAELTRALALKDEFLAMMSHELRTPLNVVLGITEAMQEGLYGPIGERQREALAAVGQSGRHLLALLSDILDLAQLEAGGEALAPQPIDVDLLCRAALAFVHGPAQAKQIHLLRTVAVGLEGLRADERRLTQILVNLLDNAVKFTPAGGSVGLEVTADPAQGAIQLVVWDTGIGIAPADYGRLFQPFTQVDGRLSRQYGGIGLGLTLVRRLVELHGGSIRLDSTLGHGSRFTVSLPWSDADNLAPVSAPVPAAPPPGWRTPPRVVLADDHEPTLAFYRDLLAQQGCEVTVARTGTEAVAQVRAARPEVAVLDLQMPELDGLTAIREIRADPEIAALPIIALTALAMPGDRERCLAAGASAYLAKPVSLRILLATIAQVLAGADAGGPGS